MTSSFLSSLVLPSFIAGFVGFFLLLYAWSINNNAHLNYTRIGVLFVGQFVLLFFTILITSANEDKKSRLQIGSFLDKKNIIIKVNGKLLDAERTKELSEALKSVVDIPAHHSSPTDEIRISIFFERDSLNLTLRRDSYIETEYWVFTDRNSESEIGRITTQFFKDKNGL